MTNKIDLLQLVIEIDNQLIQQGKEPFQRPFSANLEVGKRLNLGNRDILNDPISKQVKQLYDSLYRPTDLHTPPMHIGAFMFKDIFFPIRIPIIFGTPRINPVDFLDAPKEQKEWLFSNHQTGLTFFDQVIDLMDFIYGLDDIGKEGQLPDKTVEWWFMAKQQLEAAAATALGSIDKYAVIQSCCISAELLLKGALMASVEGITESQLSKEKLGYGHNLESLVEKTSQALPNIDKRIMLSVVKQLPNYVKSRYEAQNYSRLTLGNLLMNTQFISGEILRQFSNRNIRADFMETPTNDKDWNLTDRTFPKSL